MERQWADLGIEGMDVKTPEQWNKEMHQEILMELPIVEALINRAVEMPTGERIPGLILKGGNLRFSPEGEALTGEDRIAYNKALWRAFETVAAEAGEPDLARHVAERMGVEYQEDGQFMTQDWFDRIDEMKTLPAEVQPYFPLVTDLTTIEDVRGLLPTLRAEAPPTNTADMTKNVQAFGEQLADLVDRGMTADIGRWVPTITATIAGYLEDNTDEGKRTKYANLLNLMTEFLSRSEQTAPANAIPGMSQIYNPSNPGIMQLPNYGATFRTPEQPEQPVRPARTGLPDTGLPPDRQDSMTSILRNRR